VPKKPRGKIATWLSEELDKFYTLLAAKKKLLIFLALWSIGLNYLLEVSLRKNFLLGFIHIFAQPLVFAYNSLLIFTFFSILLVIKRRLFGFTVLNVVFLTLAITDYVVLLSRNTPLNAPDSWGGSTELPQIKAVCRTVRTTKRTGFCLFFIVGCVFSFLLLQQYSVSFETNFTKSIPHFADSVNRTNIKNRKKSARLWVVKKKLLQKSLF